MNVKCDLWSYLKQTEKPIVMYGMGNGADKIIERLDALGIAVSDFFASDGFVRGHSFHGKKVLSFSEIKEKYSDFIILLSFASSLDSVLDVFYSMNSQYEMYAPDVPVTGGGTFDLDFYNQNKESLEKARALFEDDWSKKVFDNIIEYKLTGKINLLKDIETPPDEPWRNVLSPDKYGVCVDTGAYNGDTAREMIALCKNIKRIYALEPDARNYRKLSEYASQNGVVEPLNVAAWSSDTVLNFDSSGNRNANFFSSFGKKQSEVNARTVDGICGCYADYIKYDVEGAERQAILGSKNTIQSCSPDLLVSAYHRNEDLFDLPLLIKELCPDYKLYLRKFKYVPAWDLNIYATVPPLS